MAHSALPRLLVAGLVLGLTSPAPAEDSAVPRVSIIQVPLELDLQPLFDAAEASLPRVAGHWPGWEQRHGVDVRYRAWRGALGLAMRGDLLQVQAHVRYQLQARKALIGKLWLAAGCGVDEPPRQALIGVLARLDWQPDWSLYPRFRVLPTRFLDRCEVTAADIDVSPLVGKAFEHKIETTITEAMAELAPRLQDFRAELAHTWERMQRPQELMPGVWFQLQPLGLALAPPQGSGSKLQTAVWLAFRAALSGDPAPGATTPLPPLVPYRPAQPGLHFALQVELDYPG
ncbi:MAG: hypothetical protein RLZ44_1551, partial [Pseudomonadota bacterium]